MQTKIALIGEPVLAKSEALDALKTHLNALDLDAEVCVFDRPPVGLTPAGRDEYDGVFSVGENEEHLKPWIGAVHLRVAHETKLLLAETDQLLGVPEPREIERKYLIKMPDLRELEKMPLCRAVDISQAYIIMPDSVRARIRARSELGETVYFKTIKRRISDLSKIEIEQRLEKNEYERLMEYKDKSCNVISKRRYCILRDGTYYELDVFPFWNKQAFLEVELLNEDDKVKIPDFVKIIREVTHDKRYSNSSLALSIPEEN